MIVFDAKRDCAQIRKTLLSLLPLVNHFPSLQLRHNQLNTPTSLCFWKRQTIQWWLPFICIKSRATSHAANGCSHKWWWTTHLGVDKHVDNNACDVAMVHDDNACVCGHRRRIRLTNNACNSALWRRWSEVMMLMPFVLNGWIDDCVRLMRIHVWLWKAACYDFGASWNDNCLFIHS